MKDCCEKCGNDLYCEGNILLETKSVMDKMLNNMDTECVGRPVFVVVIGDNGTESAISDALNIPDDECNDLFVECLEELLRIYQEKKDTLVQE